MKSIAFFLAAVWGLAAVAYGNLDVGVPRKSRCPGIQDATRQFIGRLLAKDKELA